MADQNDLAELIAKLQKAEARASTAEGELAKVNANFATTTAKLNERVKLAESQVGEVKLQFEMDRTLMADGITDEAAIDYIRYSYGKAPKVGDAAPAFTDFYTSYKEEKKDFLQSFRPAMQKAETRVEPKPAEKVAPANAHAASATVGAKAVVDPALGAGGKHTPAAGAGVAAAAVDPSQLANMKPADAMALLRTMGLARAAPTSN